MAIKYSFVNYIMEEYNLTLEEALSLILSNPVYSAYMVIVASILMSAIKKIGDFNE